jgi:hypothetical protein
VGHKSWRSSVLGAGDDVEGDKAARGLPYRRFIFTCARFHLAQIMSI